MFARLLIANRGEIAVRVARTCARLGIATHAVYSEADANALHVRVADGASLIGPPPVAESYLKIDAILDAAVAAGCDAVHPGYGLLSENADFAAACASRGLTFVGPRADHIRLMGHKNEARDAMRGAHFPVVPGTQGDLPEGDLEHLAEQIGYPLIVKASRGGGGIGMSIVESHDGLERAVKRARSAAQRAFGSGELYLERQVRNAHHIEVQIFGDQHGNVVHLGERECSIQRRHQKVLEESPAPNLPAPVRRALTERAVEAMRALGYVNAGTVECLANDDGEFFFLEMNTRLQVEHAATEMVTGLDLVELQLRIAAGEALALPADADQPNGHAIEARIYAEDPETFLPTPGKLLRFAIPAAEGIRVDSGFEAGDEVTPYYDPLIAKLIAWGPDRAAAIARLRDALTGAEVEGIKTNIPFVLRVLAEPAFVEGRYTVQTVPDLLGAAR